MTSREALILLDELLRTTNPELAEDVDITTNILYTFLTRAQQEYISTHFLSGDTIVDNINAIRKRSDVLRKLIKRTDINAISGADKQIDGGYEATFAESDYWMFLSGLLKHSALPTTSRGSDLTTVELNLISHYDLERKVRTVNNEPILKNVPIVLEGDNKFVFYLSSEYESAIGATIQNVDFEIIYLAFPPDVTESVQLSLPDSTHNDIVKLAHATFIREYKYLLNQGK